MEGGLKSWDSLVADIAGTERSTPPIQKKERDDKMEKKFCPVSGSPFLSLFPPFPMGGRKRRIEKSKEREKVMSGCRRISTTVLCWLRDDCGGFFSVVIPPR